MITIKIKTTDFSPIRFWAILIKEFTQMRRDHVTIGMLLFIPLLQLLLFGYAINLTPKHLPTVIISDDQSNFTRQFITSLENTNYFNIINNHATEQQANDLMARSKVLFTINIPIDFTRNLIRGNHPELLVTIDATDPTSTGSAVAALNQLSQTVFNLEFTRGLNYLTPTNPAFNLIIHNLYNPESITQYNIVPGLMGVIITMTSVTLTALAVTKEQEFGTIEMLLTTPVKPLEVILGKIAPYILVGYGQQLIIWVLSQWLFGVPSQGSFLLLLIATLPFLIANLTMGLTFSTLSKNQLQAMQMTMSFFLPSILLSGFMFPFYGMPTWAQYVGECLPLTHFNRITRGILLKNNGWENIWPDVWPLLLFILISGSICLMRYKKTLD